MPRATEQQVLATSVNLPGVDVDALDEHINGDPVLDEQTELSVRRAWETGFNVAECKNRLSLLNIRYPKNTRKAELVTRLIENRVPLKGEPIVWKPAVEAETVTLPKPAPVVDLRDMKTEQPTGATQEADDQGRYGDDFDGVLKDIQKKLDMLSARSVGTKRPASTPAPGTPSRPMIRRRV